MNKKNYNEKCLFCNKSLNFSFELLSKNYAISCGYCDIIYFYIANNDELSLSNIYFKINKTNIFMFPKNATYSNLVAVIDDAGDQHTFDLVGWESQSIDEIKNRIKKLIVFL